VHHYFVRIGSLGEIRRAAALIPLDRGQRVVVRSPRGVELAEITSACRHQSPAPPNHRILRPTTESDELLIRRLERHKCDAIEACRQQMQQSRCQATLLDVDQLLDGGTLIMHFLGDPDCEAQRIADAVASRYESVVRSEHLSELLETGCGPDCGTGDGCGTSTCGGCSGCR